MKVLEPILKKGNVYIAARYGQLLVATFISNDKHIVTVDSDRGVDHLLDLLVATINSDQQAIAAANARYPQSLSIIHTSEIMRVLEASYTKFSYPSDLNNNEYRVSIKQIIVPALNAIPGIYRRRAYASTVEKAFAFAVDAPPELQLT